MKELVNNLKGDRVIWSFVALLALFSFMPVFSASSNLAYIGHGTGNTISYLLKHLAHIFIGFIIIYWVHKVPYHYYRGTFKNCFTYSLAIVGLYIDKRNCYCWSQCKSMDSSAIYWDYFSNLDIGNYWFYWFLWRDIYRKNERKKLLFKSRLLELWMPVFITLMFILPANFSTAALIFSMVLMLVFVGKYPLKYIGFIIGMGIAALALFVLLAKAFPDSKFFSRVDTWTSRIENFRTNKPGEDDYQIEKAKIAIASGGIYGLGPGKSVQKHFLPQSSSDFIYAIIVEE